MSNKLISLDSLILEVLKERVGSLSVVDIEDIVKFGDDEITNRYDKRYATSFAQRSFWFLCAYLTLSQDQRLSGNSKKQKRL